MYLQANASAPEPVVFNYTSVGEYSFVGKYTCSVNVTEVVTSAYNEQLREIVRSTNRIGRHFLYGYKKIFINHLFNVYAMQIHYQYAMTSHVTAECDAPAVLLAEGNDASVEEFWIGHETMLAVLDLEVDYEVATDYTMVIEVVDFLRSPVLTGQATLKVGAGAGANCVSRLCTLPSSYVSCRDMSLIVEINVNNV